MPQVSLAAIAGAASRRGPIYTLTQPLAHLRSLQRERGKGSGLSLEALLEGVKATLEDAVADRLDHLLGLG
jgi:hypothetical protein